MLQQHQFWLREQDLLRISLIGQVPVLTEANGINLVDSGVISEYLEEQYPIPAILPHDNYLRAEIRRLVSICDGQLWREVTAPILEEKALRRWHGFLSANSAGRYTVEFGDRPARGLDNNLATVVGGDFFGFANSPDTKRLRQAIRQLHNYFGYHNWLLERREWLAGPERSLADFALASHIAVLDYLHSIEWYKKTAKGQFASAAAASLLAKQSPASQLGASGQAASAASEKKAAPIKSGQVVSGTGEATPYYPALKNWYARMKSRASVRNILGDRIPGLMPPRHYPNPDF